MAIKKKDGTIYKLSGPNPLLIGQELWEQDTVFKTYNLDRHDTEIYSLNKIKNISLPQVQQEPMPKIDIISTVSPPPPATTIPQPQQMQAPKKTIKMDLLYCLPSKIETITDALYGEKRSVLTYKKPFKLMGVITDNDGVYFKFWSSMEINRQSIIFHPEERRWWKVSQSEIKDDGFIMNCFVSEIEPDFSELG